MDEVALDIDVVEGVPPPNRAFAPLAADVTNRFDADHGGFLSDGAGPAPMQNQKRGLSIRRDCRQDAPMRNEAHGDVLKVWLYAAASVWLGAWISPLLYNAGKALAEVSQGKTTNGPLEWLAAVCASGRIFRRFSWRR